MILNIVNVILALIILIRLIIMADRMTWATNHRFRFVIPVLAVIVLAHALWPFYGEWAEWADTMLLAVLAIYFLSDRRVTRRIHP